MVSGAKKLSYLMAMVITGAMLIMPVVQAAEAEEALAKAKGLGYAG